MDLHFRCVQSKLSKFDHRMFRGFGGEEGYIHEKIRQRDGRTAWPGFNRRDAASDGSRADLCPALCPVHAGGYCR